MKYNLHSGYNKVIDLTIKNDYKKAEKLCRSLLKIHYKEEKLWLLLIDLLFRSDCHTKIVSLRKNINIFFPDRHPFHENLASSFSKYGYYDLAIDEYHIIISSGKSGLAHYIKLASLLFHTRRYNAVITTLVDARCLFTATSELHLMLGASYHALQNLDDALINYTTAYNIDNNNKDAITGIANVHFLRREYETASILLEPVINASAPVSAIILYCQICTENKKYDRALLLIQQTLVSQQIATTQQSMLYFISGKINDAIGNYKTAFMDYKKGNDLINPGFNCLTNEQYFETIQGIFTPEFIQEHQIDSESKRLIFIVGMPRSGTSLVEQILASHPDIYGAGELNVLNDMVKQLPKTNNNKTPYPDHVINLSNAALNEMAERYLSHINNINAEKNFITDKMPDNFQYLGLINILFPKAKIIHCTRDPHDTCLSCYFQQFSGDYPYAYKLENLGYYYNHYRDLMLYWKKTLTIPIIEVKYETLVGESRATVEGLLEYLNLVWDENCLSFNQSSRVVTTASAQQVSKVLYNTSINRWRHYEVFLSSLSNALQYED